MRLLVVSQYFWPEDFRINELVSELTGRGHEVTVLTGTPNYPGGEIFPEYAADPGRYGRFGEARIVRVPIMVRGKTRLRLVLSYLSFVLSASSFGVFRLRREAFDALFVFQPSPVTVGLPAIVLGRIKRAPVVLWILDQWPETLEAVGAVRARPVIDAVGRLVTFIYRRCDLLLTQSKSLIPVVRRYCSPDVGVDYFPNWVESVYDDEEPRPAPEITAGRKVFTVMFAGNIGEAQDFPAILAAAERLRSRSDIRWLIVGDGRMREWVAAEVARRGLHESVHLLGRYPAQRMASLYRQSDALLVTLKREPVFSMTVPGKLQTYLAVGKPVIGMLDGEGAKTIVESGAGFTCAAADSTSLAETVEKMAALTPAERSAMGEMGRAYSRREFDRDMLMSRLDRWLRTVAEVP